MITVHTKTRAIEEPRIIVSQPEQVYNPLTAHTLIKAQDQRMGQMDMRRVPLFADLADAQVETLIRDFNRRRFQQDEAIFQQGDPGQALYMVESGQVRIYVQDEEGQETSVILCGPGDLFGELALIDGLPRSASAVAMEDTVVLALSHDRFREQMRRYPQVALNLMKALSVRVRYNTQQVGSLTLLDIPGRLARKLLELAQDHGQMEPDGVRISLALTQSDLASLIGTTRESVNKAMSTFRREGLILVRQNHITIADPDALRKYAS
jgi:CRP/FNR family cyclic AMP-dependent transcriptional regulator